MTNTSNKIFRKENLGQTIRKYRMIHGLSMEELAKLLNLSPAFVGLIERGSRGVNLKNLVRLSEIFDIDINLLLYDISQEDLLEDSETPEKIKLRSLNALCSNLDEEELDFISDYIKSFKKFKYKDSNSNSN